MMTHRKIIHIDLDAFYCAVEELRDPSLQRKAFAVGGRPDQRGVVSSCSYAARKFGVRSAMPTARAVQLCPQLIIVRGHHKLYSENSRQVMTILRNYTSLVEQISIDEAFLDVSEVPQPAKTSALQIQAKINQELNLSCSLGISTNKLVAKIATDVGKATIQTDGSPNAIQIVPPGEEAGFLAPLPVEMLWGVGPKTAAVLAKMMITKIGDIVNYPEIYLVECFGKLGHSLYRRSRGIDKREIVTSHLAKSVSNESTFNRDINDKTALLRKLENLSKRVCKRLQKQQLAGTTVKLKLRWSDFTTFTRQTTIDQPTNKFEDVFEAARNLFLDNWPSGKTVRLLGVGVSGLGPPIRQLRLWESDSEITRLEKERQLREALSSLQEKFGNRIIHWGPEEDPKNVENN